MNAPEKKYLVQLVRGTELLWFKFHAELADAELDHERQKPLVRAGEVLILATVLV